MGVNLRKLFLGEVLDVRLRMPPQRYGQNLLALQQALRNFRLHVPEERVQRCQALVLRSGRTMPLMVKVLQKGLDERRIGIGE